VSSYSFKLPVSDGHVLHVERAGNPDGIPVLFLHGGPGAGINGNYQWPFNLDDYDVVAFDQRGCGQSKPFGSLEHNSTKHLVNDIEAIRQHLDIKSWCVFGGSWGATLALVYAIAHPKRVNHLMLRGIFLARQQDFDWFLQADGGAAQVYPDAYANFKAQVMAHQDSSDITDAYYELFASEDESLAQQALSAWFNWEGAISKLIPDPSPSSDVASTQQVKSLALLECHYLKHQCFIEENYILSNARKLQDIPVDIVHGRYDMVCKVGAAYELHKTLPQSQLYIINDAGHSASESGIRQKLIEIVANAANVYKLRHQRAL
jgi:proline iminopeptidase